MASLRFSARRNLIQETSGFDTSNVIIPKITQSKTALFTLCAMRNAICPMQRGRY